MIEVTFFVPHATTDAAENEWRTFLDARFGNFTQGKRVFGSWRGHQECMIPFTVLMASRLESLDVVATIKRIFNEDAVYVRYGEAEVL